MFAPSWIRSVARTLGFRRRSTGNACHTQKKPFRRMRLRLEQLEDRTVPTILNLTTLNLSGLPAPVTSGTINDALFDEAIPYHNPTVGSGNTDSFGRLDKDGSEQGYNTDFRPKQFDEGNTATFDHSIQLKPTVRSWLWSILRICTPAVHRDQEAYPRVQEDVFAPRSGVTV